MNNVMKHLGNLLIIFSLVVFGIVALPYILARIPRPVAAVDQAGYFISIPSIQATSPIVVGVDPWNQDEYNTALSRGIAQAEGTFLPGEGKLIYLFAHSSGFPWEILDKNIPFLRLDELEQGDIIGVHMEGREYRYIVSGKKVVDPNETQYLQNTKVDVLVLQTCWPIGTDWKRLLVFAKPSATPE